MPTLRRPAVTAKLQRQIWQEAAHQCAYCHSPAEGLRVHHIQPWAEVKRHEFENLILLCGTCHNQADEGDISRDQLDAIKRTLHQRRQVVGVMPPDQPTNFNVHQISQGKGAMNVVAQQIRIVGHARSPKVHIVGSVCDDPRRVGYLQYLAKRFNHFKEWEVGKARMRYGAIHSAYAREMRYAIKTTPLDQFLEGASYLQHRISGTKLGRMFGKQGRALFVLYAGFDIAAADEVADIPQSS